MVLPALMRPQQESTDCVVELLLSSAPIKGCRCRVLPIIFKRTWVFPHLRCDFLFGEAPSFARVAGSHRHVIFGGKAPGIPSYGSCFD